jgi:penicillin V acylase-like amidase (Ntn superfamily)
VKVHFMISDKCGSAATIEFLKGALVAHTGKDLAVQTLTNDSYAKSIAYLRVANSNKTTSQGSLDRFYRAAKRTQNFEVEKRSELDSINYAFDTLNNVTQGIGTQWSIVYDQLRRKIYFRTQQKRQIRTIDTTRLDFSCSTDVKVLDVNTDDSGDITDKFVGYTRKANRDLIDRSFNGTEFLKSIPGSIRDFFASYSESFPCQETTSDRVAGPRRH